MCRGRWRLLLLWWCFAMNFKNSWWSDNAIIVSTSPIGHTSSKASAIFQHYRNMTCTLGCYLDRVEPAVAIEGEANDVCWVLVPAGVDWVTHNVSSLREDLLDEDLLPAQGDPLAQVWCDANHQAVTGLCHPSLLALLLPALQLFYHGRQLVIARLLVQQVEVLYHQTNMEMRAVSLHVDAILSAMSLSKLHLICKVIKTEPCTCTEVCNSSRHIHRLSWWLPHSN